MNTVQRAASWLLLRTPLVGPYLRREALRTSIADISPDVMLKVTCPCGETHSFGAQRALSEPEVYQVALDAWKAVHRAHWQDQKGSSRT